MTHHIVGIYSIDNCKYCEQAKTLLEMKKIPYKEQKIESSEDREQLKKLFPNARSFPIIVIDHVHIGGFTNLQEWLKNEKF